MPCGGGRFPGALMPCGGGAFIGAGVEMPTACSAGSAVDELRPCTAPEGAPGAKGPDGTDAARLAAGVTTRSPIATISSNRLRTVCPEGKCVNVVDSASSASSRQSPKASPFTTVAVMAPSVSVKLTLPSPSRMMPRTCRRIAGRRAPGGVCDASSFARRGGSAGSDTERNAGVPGPAAADTAIGRTGVGGTSPVRATKYAAAAMAANAIAATVRECAVMPGEGKRPGRTNPARKR